MDYEEEYEVIPTSPIRKLEKRISRIETVSSSSEIRRLIEQIIELIKSNQRIIDDVIKADAELRHEISALPGKMDELIANINEFIDILKASASEEAGASSKEALDPLLKKITELVEQNKKTQEIGQATLTSLETIDKRLKRVLVQSPRLYRGQQ
jgi:predicted transcriptional regulator